MSLTWGRYDPLTELQDREEMKRLGILYEPLPQPRIEFASGNRVQGEPATPAFHQGSRTPAGNEFREACLFWSFLSLASVGLMALGMAVIDFLRRVM